jgi:quercetin dioxygenase-like cupin family protein
MRIRDLIEGVHVDNPPYDAPVIHGEGADHLAYLRQLTAELPGMVAGTIHYTVENGTCLGFSMWHDDEMAVQRAFMSKGTVFPAHIHPGHEWVIIKSGHGRAHVVGQDPLDLTPGMGVHFEPGQEHTFEVTEDTWLLCLTVPADEGYPHNAGTSRSE